MSVWEFARQQAAPYWGQWALGVSIRILFRLLPLQTPIVAGGMIQGLKDGDASAIPFYGATLTGLALLTGCSAYASVRIRRRMEQAMEDELQRKVWMAWQQAAPSFRRQHGADRFATQTLRYSSGLGDLAGSCAIEGSAMACRIVYPVLMLLALDPLLAMLPIAFVPVQWLFSHLAWAQSQRHIADVREASRRKKRIWRESLDAVETVQALRAHDQCWQWISEAELHFVGAKTASRRYERIVSGGLWGLASLGLALSWWMGGIRVISGTLTLGQLVTFTGFVGFLSLPLRRFGALARQANSALTKLGEVESFLRQAIPMRSHTESRRGGAGEIRLADIRFELDGKCLFDGLDFRFPAGERIWIRGRGGSGKSTLLRLLAGLERPSSGGVELDGEMLTGPTDDVLLAPQEVTIFEASLRDNLLMGLADASEERLTRSCNTAGLGALLDRLPQGLDTLLGDHGVRLAAAERRCLGVARALLRQPRVLLLDESTAALDEKAELALLEELRKVLPAITVILVANHVKSLASIDRIIELRDGRLIELPVK